MNINEVIAKHKGLEYSARGFDVPGSGGFMVNWRNKNTGKLYAGCPDYEHDARLYMALFEEMPKPDLFGNSEIWYCCADLGTGINAKSDTIGGAICAAWCAWKGVEG